MHEEIPGNDIDEAVCFTAGPEGAAFGAGVIHAYIAAERKAPRVVAGISTGAITAAAFQRSMMERGPKAHRTEATRWSWFQRYLTDILDRPLDVIWKAFPDPVDFLSPTEPVRDLSCPKVLKRDECESRYHFWQLTKLGHWLSRLTISIGAIGRLALLKVRRDERIQVRFLRRGLAAVAWRNATFNLTAFTIGLRLLANIILHPQFTRTPERFSYEDANALGATPECGPGVLGVRPLFGWGIWLLACAAGILLTLILALLVWLFHSRHLPAAIITLLVIALLFTPRYKKGFRSKLKKIAGRIQPDGHTTPADPTRLSRLLSSALRNAGIELNLISNYQFKRRVWNRFQDPKYPDKLLVRCGGNEEISVLIVAAVLQSLSSQNKQTWAHHGVSLVEALAAACAIPRFFPPWHVESKEAGSWIRKKDLDLLKSNGGGKQEFDLIDGSVVRKNPLPALFNWLHEKDKRTVAESLTSRSIEDPRIHVIYNVPIEPFDAYEGKEPPDRIDLVEAAQVGLLMRTRRDTSTEVLQTNYLSNINCANNFARGSAQKSVKDLAIFADEIAPDRELKFENPLSPSREEGLELTAQGCRRTLGRLYRVEIERLATERGSVACSELLRSVARDRKDPRHMGLPEVCAQCTGRLQAYRQPPRKSKLVHEDFGQEQRDVGKAVENLCKLDRPRIVFVASGGVFRGAFQIGMLGAMQAFDITPDLVVGASVGTLMGAALANMRHAAKPEDQLRALADLSDTFLHVDETVALTVPVKTAAKQLGLRARQLSLSPAKLRKAVRAGTRRDAGYAATGVPPLVMDTLSGLLIIPPRETTKAGADFVAGRFSKAAFALIVLIREHTLESLGVRYAVIGTSLLEGAARILLGGLRSGVDLQRRQPYVKRDGTGTAIFCTTAFVNQRWPLLLGRDALERAAQDYDFLYAALSSSAFPAAFSPRQAAEVFPGAGKSTNLFCDGGTFDNLPFIPTIELLQEAQSEAFKCERNQDPRAFLKKRLEHPDLILSGGFDPLEENDLRPRFTSLRDVAARAGSLGHSVKTQSFIAVSSLSQKRLRDLYHDTDGMTNFNETLTGVMTGSVVAEVINIVPSSTLHVNPTFAFSRAMGFERERVAASIADGCFQTLLNLEPEYGDKSDGAKRSLKARNIEIKLRGNGNSAKGECPYFQVQCPFFRASVETKDRASRGCAEIYESCKADPVHQKLIQRKAPSTEEHAPEKRARRVAALGR
jgi:predicted acylesterase/phospholipase RssA